MPDYKTIFERIETSLITEGSKSLPVERIRENLEWTKHLEQKRFTDNEYYQKLVDIIFYSGFRAATVTEKIPVIHMHFPDYVTVVAYNSQKIDQILADDKMIRNRRKIEACVEDARAFQKLIREHGSIQNFVETFSPAASLENILRLRDDLVSRFRGLGKVTAFHFLTDIGLPVLKPDRVICRIFERLGLVENKDELLDVVLEGRKFADATGFPIRYIDIVFVAYGQVQSREIGIERGICLEKKPLCNLCEAQNFCLYYSKQPV